MSVCIAAGLTSNLVPTFAAPICNSLNTVPERMSTSPTPKCSDHGFLKNVMSLNKDPFSPLVRLSNLARFYSLAGLTENPVSAGPLAPYLS